MNIYTPLSHIHLTLTFFPLALSFSPSCLSGPCLTSLTYPSHVCGWEVWGGGVSHNIVSEPCEDKLHTLWPFTPKYFSVYFLRIMIFPYIPTVELSTSVHSTSVFLSNLPSILQIFEVSQ